MTTTPAGAYHLLMMAWPVQSIKIILSALFLVAFAVFLVTSNVRWAFNSVELYELGFSRHQVDRTTGLTQQQLSLGAHQIRDYFNSSEELLSLRITVGSAERELYDEREILHMRDVKELAWNVYRVQEGMFLYLLLFSALGFFIMGNDFAGRFRRLLIKGSVLTVTLVGLVGLASLALFGPLFRLFHVVSFRNDLWQLDPYSSYLVQMFPQGFWLDATLLIGFACIVESGAIVVLLMLIGLWQQWRQRVAQSKAPQFV